MDRRHFLAIMLAVACIGTTCRERRNDEQPGPPGKSSEKLDESPSSTERFDMALGAANDEIEAARILSLPTQPLPESRLQGVALPMYSELPDLTYPQMLERIRSVGATHVSVVLSWNQQTIYHNRIERGRDDTPSDEQVAGIVQRARALGLEISTERVMNKARLDAMPRLRLFARVASAGSPTAP